MKGGKPQANWQLPYRTMLPDAQQEDRASAHTVRMQVPDNAFIEEFQKKMHAAFSSNNALAMDASVKVDTQRRRERPASAMSSVSAVKENTENKLYWRGISHTIIPELLQGAHTKKMLASNEGLPSIADQVLTTSLASIIPSAPFIPDNPKKNAWLNATAQSSLTGIEQADAPEKSGLSIGVVTAAQSLKPKSLLAASRRVSMVSAVRGAMMQHIVADYSKDEQLRHCNAKIESLQAHITSLNALLAAKESSCPEVIPAASAGTTQAPPEPSAHPSSSEIHTAMVMRIEQLETSRGDLKRQLMAFQDFTPVYKEILAILGQTEGKKTAAQIVRTIEDLIDSKRTSSERIFELQEKLEAAENEMKMAMRHKRVELESKESEIVLLKNQLEQQRGLAVQAVRNRDEAIEGRMQLECSMLRLKISLKLLAESWGCDTSLVVDAENFVSLLSQAMIGKSSARDALQAVQGVINTTWLEILASQYPGKKIPGDAISGIRLIYESMKVFSLQNEQLSKNLKAAKIQVAEARQELEKWKRTRASVTCFFYRALLLLPIKSDPTKFFQILKRYLANNQP
jgi:hypothetical protein